MDLRNAAIHHQGAVVHAGLLAVLRVRWILNVISVAAESSIGVCLACSPRVNPHY